MNLLQNDNGCHTCELNGAVLYLRHSFMSKAYVISAIYRLDDGFNKRSDENPCLRLAASSCDSDLLHTT